MNYEQLLSRAEKFGVDNLYALSKDAKLKPAERKFCYDIARRLRNGPQPTIKQLKWLNSILDAQEDPTSTRRQVSGNSFDTSLYEEPVDSEIRHLCLRTAWHDSRWDGRVCRNPDSNEHCVGEFSLLSDRVRQRRDLAIENAPGCPGCAADAQQLGDYRPPCFWSINAFGENELQVVHDNPAAPDFPLIAETLPPYSMISWPFRLSFVRDDDEKKQYGGNYYPREIFENRIRLFQHKVRPLDSIVFSYCNFSNPVSGEERKYLVTGCARLEDQSDPKFFDITEETLASKASALGQPNFPRMNWALTFTWDFPDSGVRIPYHEYLERLGTTGSVTDERLQSIAVTIDEPELRDGFTYVAKHIDDDQAIYLLTKIRRSLLRIKEHGILDPAETVEQVRRVEDLIESSWIKRGYLPGLKALLLSMPGVAENYADDVGTLVRKTDFSEADSVERLRDALSGAAERLPDASDGLLEEAREFMDEYGIQSLDLLRLASLNLTRCQFLRLAGGKSMMHALSDICANPYLLHEEYQAGEDLEDPLTGERIDGSIDLFRIDLALIPLSKYQKRINFLHDYRSTDPRRLRAVVIDILAGKEYSGDCFLSADEIAKDAEQYSLFYKVESPYSIRQHLVDPSEQTLKHFNQKLVARVSEGCRYYYLKPVFDDEIFVRGFIKRLIDKPDHSLSAKTLRAGIAKSLDVLRARIGERFDAERFKDERVSLYDHVAGRSFYVIRGVPGGGKSYELLKLVQHLVSQGELCVVLSLTGKAVIRLRHNEEGIRAINAKTIDKFLAEREGMREQAVSSPVHNLIIDEASMVDLPKLAAVLRAIDERHLKRLILVGDANQLPPIGFGKPFSDIVEWMAESPDQFRDYGISLDVNCRAEMSDDFLAFTRVFSDAAKFAEGRLAETALGGQFYGGNLEIVFWNSRDDLRQALSARVIEMLAEAKCGPDELPLFLGIRSATSKPENLERTQVLSPYRSGFYGASGLNLFFQDDLRPGVELSEKIGERLFKIHDKVMHTENEYHRNELVVSNGSLGATFERRRIFFLDRDEAINAGELRTAKALEPAYAITVHKSQGSGFGHVFIVLPEKARFTSRELLYTALTRARNRVTIFIQQGEDVPGAPDFLGVIRSRSAVVGRRTSLFGDNALRYAYMPEEGVVVKSRVEYIIYRKLLEAKNTHGTFSFCYEGIYEVQGRDFDFHPDFRLEFADGRVVLWEHLGMVTSRAYLDDWDKRRAIYEAQGDFEKVMTTDELRGISDQKIEVIIGDVIANNLVSEDETDRYSRMHFSLR